MACNTLSTINSPALTGELFRRTFSDNNIHIRCSSTSSAMKQQHKLKKNRSTGNLFNLDNISSSSLIPGALRSLLMDLETRKEANTTQFDGDELMMEFESGDDDDGVAKRSNWVERLLQLRDDWRRQQKLKDNNNNGDDGEDNMGQLLDDDDSSCNEEGCEVNYDDDEENDDVWKNTFSDMLRPVSLSDIKLFSRLAFLSNMAYVIPEINAEDLRRYYGLEFVTSSLMNKLEADQTEEATFELQQNKSSDNYQQKRLSIFYGIVASAASYVQSHRNNNNDNKPVSREGDDQEMMMSTASERVHKSERAACVAASAVTAVVAAGEKTKEAAARELQTPQSSPCDWFVCDDSGNHTRCFVIQGSDSVASWQANLLFEPTKFEDTDVLVHRGIYEAAKGIYEQFMPEIEQHLREHGDKAKLQFTGHSLGGSLSLVVNLMLLTRNVVNPNCLLPVVTFGSPFVFCGGERVFNQLGLTEDHVHCVMMHRDIVPRAFSCNYPDHVATVLKRLNGTFRSHPCLNKNKLLYSPMGKIFILQPDDKLSPPHPLLPAGSGLYTLQNNKCSSPSSSSSTKKALRAFLNSPHPLETLSDLTAYGSDGTILRDHDSSHYLRAVNDMIRKHRRQHVRNARNQMMNMHWPLLTSQSPHAWTQEHCLVMDSATSVSQEIVTGV